MKVTFICCYNNAEELNSMLLPSFGKLDKDTVNYILIDSTLNNYRSAAEAYNKTIEKHKDEIGEILIFLHQDIAFSDSGFLEKIISELTANPNQILGFAGINDFGTVFSNLKYRKDKSFITRNQIKEKTQVCTVDECCFAMTKILYQKLLFDEYVCNHWHLYAVEICYNAKKNKIPCYVLPDVIYHKEFSGGGLQTDSNFLTSMWRLVIKYGKEFNCIYAPCYICKTNRLQAAAKLFKTSIKNLFLK